MILVTGAKGQLGSELGRILRPEDALFYDRDELDITDAAACQRVVAEHGIDTIINAAAYTAVDKAESDKDAAYAINQHAVANLAKALAKEGKGKSCLIQISTDYVFEGTTCVPYTEEDTPNPQSIYGASKLAGEGEALAHAPTAAVFRTAWLYSALGGGNFVKTMLRLGAEKEALNVVFDQIGTPTSARHLARDIVKALPLIQAESHEIYHYTDEGVASWYDFACAIMKLAGLSCVVGAIRSAQYPTPAKRPAFSVLDKTKVKQAFGLTLNPWQEAILPCIHEIRSAS